MGLNKKGFILALTLKQFAKVLKISDSALLERMQNAGLKHSSGSDEITPADKQALLKSLKGGKAPAAKSVTPSGKYNCYLKK